MIVQSCTFAVHFPKNLKIRENFFLLESHFEGFQTPFTLVPVPPDAPLELPRIIANTTNGHSQLVINGECAQLTTTFDENFCHDISKCIEYIRSKSNSIISSLTKLGAEIDGKPKFYFSGLSTTLLCNEETGGDSPIKYISEKFLKCKSNLPLEEAEFRLAYVVSEKYYVNVLAQNVHPFMNSPDERGAFVSSVPAPERFQIIVDINDRYAFNHTVNYLSSEETANSVISLADVIIRDHLDEFIKDGAINYAE